MCARRNRNCSEKLGSCFELYFDAGACYKRGMHFDELLLIELLMFMAKERQPILALIFFLEHLIHKCRGDDCFVLLVHLK